jgi:hypothetical protein
LRFIWILVLGIWNLDINLKKNNKYFKVSSPKTLRKNYCTNYLTYHQ